MCNERGPVHNDIALILTSNKDARTLANEHVEAMLRQVATNKSQEEIQPELEALADKIANLCKTHVQAAQR